MSLATPAGSEVVQGRAPLRDQAARPRFAELLAVACSAREPGRSGAGSRARTDEAPVPGPVRGPGRSAGLAAEAASGAPAADLAAGGAPAPDRRAPADPDPPGAAELEACVRKVPAAIAAALRPGGAELALTFGPALALDLRCGAQGLELTLRPASGLERATRAELPGLVEALRARGLRVARAEVRPRAPAPRRPR